MVKHQYWSANTRDIKTRSEKSYLIKIDESEKENSQFSKNYLFQGYSRSKTEGNDPPVNFF